MFNFVSLINHHLNTYLFYKQDLYYKTRAILEPSDGSAVTSEWWRDNGGDSGDSNTLGRHQQWSDLIRLLL